MSAPAAIPVATAVPDPATPGEDRPSRFAHLLGLVRKLIDYGKELAATLQQRATNADLAAVTLPFGTRDIALILARITRGLLRANALEARVVALAARPDAPPAPSRAPAQRAPRAPRPAAVRPNGESRPSPCPSAHAGADRRRGPPPAGRRCDCRYLPRSRHPAEPSAVAGTELRHHRLRRQPRPPVHGHPGPGVADPSLRPGPSSTPAASPAPPAAATGPP